nr:protein of unknown function (DUF1180) [uncultured bacterium]
MPMADTIATAADYADAMMTARKAKALLFLLLLLVLLAQLSIFFVAAYTDVIVAHAPNTATTETGDVVPASGPATVPTTDQAKVSVETDASSASFTASRTTIHQGLELLVGVSVFIGVMLPIVLTFVLLLIVGIMLVGRLIGVSRITSAFIWTIVLMVLLFPWQAFLDANVWRWPGVLYTWDELMSKGQFMHTTGKTIFDVIIGWGRFVAMPVVAMLILMSIQIKSNRGMRQALGESVADVGTGV